MTVRLYFVNSQHSSIEELKGAITGMGWKDEPTRLPRKLSRLSNLIGQLSSVQKIIACEKMVVNNLSILNGYT